MNSVEEACGGRSSSQSQGSSGSSSRSSITDKVNDGFEGVPPLETSGTDGYLNKLKKFNGEKILAGYCRRLLLFSFLYAWFFALKSFTNSVEVGIISLEEVFGLMGPLILVPVWYELWLNNTPIHIRSPNRFEAALFIWSVAMWSQGSGIHLSSNSINQTVGQDPDNAAFAVTDFWDEQIGHIWSFLGMMFLHCTLVWAQYRHPFTLLTKENEDGKFGFFQRRYRGLVAMTIFAGIVNGFIFFLNMIEGQFGFPGFVFSMGNVILQINFIIKRAFKNSPVFLFSLTFNALSAVLTIVWFAINGGQLLEFTEVGLCC